MLPEEAPTVLDTVASVQARTGRGREVRPPREGHPAASVYRTRLYLDKVGLAAASQAPQVSSAYKAAGQCEARPQGHRSS